ncbi:hypothetical protein Tco_1279959, partial [Tanacetum coccineum]
VQETELGIEMIDIEFFEKLHKKDKGKGTWCDLRAERAATKYREIVMKNNGSNDLVDIPFLTTKRGQKLLVLPRTTKGMDLGLQNKQRGYAGRQRELKDCAHTIQGGVMRLGLNKKSLPE